MSFIGEKRQVWITCTDEYIEQTLGTQIDGTVKNSVAQMDLKKDESIASFACLGMELFAITLINR